MKLSSVAESSIGFAVAFDDLRPTNTGKKKLLTATPKVMNPETSVKALHWYCSFQRKKKRKTTKVAAAEANADTKG